MQRRFLLVARTAIATAMLVLVAPVAVLAGGAEPLRIEFKRGAHSATISESVRDDIEADYVLGAKEGQRLSSGPEDFHLRALPEPYVNLSIHTAPIVRLP